MELFAGYSFYAQYYGQPLTYLNEQEIMPGSITTCHFMHTSVSLVDCCYWHVGWFVVYSFCATYLLITDQFRFDFICLSTLFNFLYSLHHLKLFVGFSLTV